MTAKGTTVDTGGEIGLSATSDISIEAPLYVASGPLAGGAQALMDIEAGGSVNLDRVTINSFNDGGSLTVIAGGNIALLGNVAVVGNAVPEIGASGGTVFLAPGPTATVRIARKVDVSCRGEPGPCIGGSISITPPGCLVDVTGATLVARPLTDTFGIDLGCSCVHAPSNACDGGCAGLDHARIDPPLGPLPMCSP
jgi:hypothetical protein